MKNTDDNKQSFWNKVSCTHKKLAGKYKELDSIITILGVMVFGSTVVTLCNSGTNTKAEVKASLTNNKAEEYFFQGEYSKAISEYQKMQSGQEWPYYEAKLAEVYSASGDINRSNELLDEVVKKRVNLITQNGIDQYKSGDAELGCLVSYLSYLNGNNKALEYAKSFYEDNMDDFNMNIMMFTLYLQQGDKESARNILNNLYENDKEKSAYELAVLSKMYITLQDNSKGLEILKEAWEEDKNDLKVYDVVSEITSSSINNLLSEIDQLSKDNEDEPCYKVWLLKHYSEDSMSSSKYNDLKNEIYSEKVESYVVELIEQGFFKGADNDKIKQIIEKLERKEDPTYSDENIIATYYQNKGNNSKALEYAAKSVNSNRDYDKNYIDNIPNSTKAKSDNVRVESYYRQAISTEPFNGDAILELADYYKNELSNNEKAYEFYEIAEKIEPDSAEIIYNMAMIKFEDKDINEGIELINKCISLDPNEAKYHRALGKAYYDIGKKDEVINEIRKAYKNDNDDIVALNNAGCYYISIGNDIDRGLYNLKCAYEMIKSVDDLKVKKVIIANYEAAKEVKKSSGNDVSTTVNPLLFEMLY